MDTYRGWKIHKFREQGSLRYQAIRWGVELHARSEPELLQMIDRKEDQAVKCACGHLMRFPEWTRHWATCKIHFRVDLKPGDLEALKAQEEKEEKDRQTLHALGEQRRAERLARKAGRSV